MAKTDYRSTPYDKGGLGIYKATQQTGQVVGGSSLDQAPGTLSARSVQATGLVAQRIITATAPMITKDTTVAQKSYLMSSAMGSLLPLASADVSIVANWASQASNAQLKSLGSALTGESASIKNAVMAGLDEAGKTIPEGINPLFLLIGGFVAYQVLK